MKANMSASGELVIIPESGVEAYALSHWARRNLGGSQVEAMIDCSNFPSMLIHKSDCATHNEPAYPNGPCDCGATGG